MKLCLPRKARFLAKSQLSTACAKQIAECGVWGGGGRGAGGILPQQAGRTGALLRDKSILGHRGGRRWGRSEGQCPCGDPGVGHLVVPQVGTAQGSRCQERVTRAKTSPSKPPAWLRRPRPPRHPAALNTLTSMLSKVLCVFFFFSSNLFGLFKN